MSEINEVNFGVTELVECSAKGDEVFVEVELSNDVVAFGEDEGVWIVVIASDELIVSWTTIEGVRTGTTVENILATTAVELVIFV